MQCKRVILKTDRNQKVGDHQNHGFKNERGPDFIVFSRFVLGFVPAFSVLEMGSGAISPGSAVV